MRCTHEMQAHEMQANEMHAYEMQAHEMYAYEMQAMKCMPMRCMNQEIFDLSLSIPRAKKVLARVSESTTAEASKPKPTKVMPIIPHLHAPVLTN